MGTGDSKPPADGSYGWMESQYKRNPPKNVNMTWREDGYPYPAPPIPDYRKYKIEGNPIAEKYQRRLAQEGLTDPWLRNHVWKFDHGKNHQVHRVFKSIFFGKGALIGLGLTALTIAIDETFGVRKYLMKRGW